MRDMPKACSCHQDQSMSDPEEYAAKVRAWVERTCAEQGVPVKITDPVTVRRVATLLDGKVRRGD